MDDQPSLSAAPLTRHSVATMRSVLAGVTNALIPLLLLPCPVARRPNLINQSIQNKNQYMHAIGFQLSFRFILGFILDSRRVLVGSCAGVLYVQDKCLCWDSIRPRQVPCHEPATVHEPISGKGGIETVGSVMNQYPLRVE